jgi:CubicO group peptidase (beta-lactamase class C family)
MAAPAAALIAVLLAAPAPPAPAVPPPASPPADASAGDDVASKLDRLASAYHDAGLLDGMVLVAERGKVVLEKGYGMANVEWQQPNRPDTRYRIGSVTKPLTAILVLQQVNAGRLDLDAPISRYLPEYRKDTGAKVTVRHLLAHTSGIPTYKGTDILAQLHPLPSGDLVRQWCSGDLRWEPGARWDYNNCGYLMLAVILERVTGRSYADLLREGITVPAGMADTGVDTSRLVLPRRASGYERDLAGDLRLAPYSEISTALGAGDVYSTARDLFRLDRALYGDGLLPAGLRKAMFTPDNARTGLGWFVRTAPADHPAAGDTLVTHEGHIFGFFTFVTRIPEREALVITIDNADSDAFPGIHREALRILYQGTYELPRRPMRREVGRALRDGGPAAAVARFRELRAAGPGSGYDVENWRALNSLGYELLRGGRTREAIAVFQANAGAFPERWELWDSLAEGYMADGQREPAIRCYEKSVEMNPRNEAGIEALGKLRAGSG